MAETIAELVEETGHFSPELRDIVSELLRVHGPLFVFGYPEPAELLAYPQDDQSEWIRQNHIPLTAEAMAAVRERLTSDQDNKPRCEGHYDDDYTLLSGAGIGEPTFCNGSCNPGRKDRGTDD